MRIEVPMTSTSELIFIQYYCRSRKNAGNLQLSLRVISVTFLKIDLNS